MRQQKQLSISRNHRSRGRDKEESGEAAESAAEGDLVATADYPTKPITMIIPYAAGGTTDVWGRS